MKVLMHKELSVGVFFLNILIGIIIAIIAQILTDDYFEPRRQGFYCNDQSIRKSFQYSTIPTPMLYALVTIVPFSAILITELIRSLQRKELYSWHGYNVNQIIVNCSKYYAYHLLGLLLALILTLATQLVVGGLRPNFIEVCQPNINLNECLNNTYITDYKCKRRENMLVKHARQSFYSKHAALGLTSAVFFIVYWQARIPHRSYTAILRPLVQIFALALGLYVGYTRVIDKKHHLHDVLVGYIVGAIIGYLTASQLALLSTHEMLKKNEGKICRVDTTEQDEGIPGYKTSIVRVEPTELRLFD